MRIKKIVFISFLTFVIQLTSCAENELEIKAQGVVTDIINYKYEPIDSAEVKLWEEDRLYFNFLTKTYTDSQGFYFLTYIVEGEFHRLSINATKDGYYPSLQEAVNCTENLQTINLQLQKKSTINDSVEVIVF
jgi:hypothetical protein